MDAGNGVPQVMPPKPYVAGFDIGGAPAGSFYRAALKKGGPTGYFVFAHLHGIHNDRNGSSEYAMGAIIQDASGYAYATIPANHYTIRGTSRRPRRYGHCSIQWTVPNAVVADIFPAIRRGETFQLVPIRSRNRTNGLEEFIKEHGEDLGRGALAYLTGGSSEAATFLNDYNKGKTKK